MPKKAVTQTAGKKVVNKKPTTEVTNKKTKIEIKNLNKQPVKTLEAKKADAVVQNKKQLDIFTSASIGNYRYIKMGRLGPLMTSFSSDDIIREIRRKIIENISNINHNLLVEYNRLKNRLIYYPNDYKGDVTDTYLKIHYSLNILITRQKYPPGSNTYVYVIQNLTHYTDQEIICNTATKYCKEDDNGKLVNMILHTISDTNTGNGKFRKFRDILKTTGGNVTLLMN